MRRLSAWALAGILATPAAVAQPADVQTLIDRATEDFRAGRYDASRALFEEAWRKTSDNRLLYMIGRCHEELGELPAAVEAFERFLVGEAPPDAREKGLEHLRAVRERMATGTLRVDVQPQQAQVFVDGVLAGTGPAVELKVQAGDRTVEVRAEGFTTTTRQVAVPGSGSAVVAVALAQVVTAPTPPPVVVTTPEETGPELSSWGWGLLGGGAALLVGGSVLYGLGEADHGSIEDAASPGGGPPSMTRARALELEQRGDDLKLGGAVLWGLGGAAAVSAVTLLILDATDEPPVSVGAGADGLWVFGTF